MRNLGRRPLLAWLASTISLAATLPRTWAAETKVWRAGNYSFSDEKGGFAIRGVSGLGTEKDPVIIEQELYSASPVTMVIRAAGYLDKYDRSAADLTSGSLYLRLATRNASGQAWLEFEFELQETEGKASIFSDGLSFNQKGDSEDGIGSTGFSKYDRDFEPYDRLRFINGKVDVRQTVDFSFALTDFTPRQTFFLVEDPRIPFS